MQLLFVVLDFPSHRAWAEGYQRASGSQHTVRLEIMKADRWKWRMQAAAAEIEALVSQEDDVVIVDGMLDVTALVALLHSSGQRCPKIVLYMHENQLTTPFASNDRDKKNKTHWHYGVAHYRSLLVADGLVFNSQQHLDVFADALPRLIQQQCPRDTVAWHLDRAEERLKTRCTVLRSGLDLEELASLVVRRQGRQQVVAGAVPTILWNARLEEDKDPACFIDTLEALRRSGATPFRLIVLGSDSTRGAKWHTRFQTTFADELIHIGWCSEREEYAKWLLQADVVLSTAQHETFGISIIESVFCGALPLLPLRLSYPELFPPEVFPEHFYISSADCLVKLTRLLSLDSSFREEAAVHTRAAISRFCWSVMGPLHDEFWSKVAKGESIVEAGFVAAAKEEQVDQTIGISTNWVRESADEVGNGVETSSCDSIDFEILSDPEDPRLALYRPKSLRDQVTYHAQLAKFQEGDLEPSIHGGRRPTQRMLEAMTLGARITPLSFLATSEMAKNVLAPAKCVSCPSVPVYVVEKDLLDIVRGQKINAGDAILSLVQFPISVPIEQLIAKPPILVLEDVRYADNLGSILRTAFCLGISSVVASHVAWTCIQDTRAARCSMGTLYYHMFCKSESLESTLATIREAGIRVYGVEIGPDGAKPVAPHGSDIQWAMVLANEDLGMTQQTQEACDDIVFIPQAHGDSLNVGHAAAIALFELGREGPIPQHDGQALCS